MILKTIPREELMAWPDPAALASISPGLALELGPREGGLFLGRKPTDQSSKDDCVGGAPFWDHCSKWVLCFVLETKVQVGFQLSRHK